MQTKGPLLYVKYSKGMFGLTTGCMDRLAPEILQYTHLASRVTGSLTYKGQRQYSANQGSSKCFGENRLAFFVSD